MIGKEKASMKREVLDIGILSSCEADEIINFFKNDLKESRRLIKGRAGFDSMSGSATGYVVVKEIDDERIK